MFNATTASKLVKKMTADTRARKLVWIVQDPSTSSREDRVGPIYGTFVVDKAVNAYRYTYEYFFDEENHRTQEDVAIEFVDEHGVRLWRIPDVPERRALMDAIEFTASNIDKTIDAYLVGEKDEDEPF
jgi:hypothetical protein